MKMYLVGGAVRDELLGVKSNDLDYTVVFEDGDLVDVDDPFTFMVEWLTNLGFKIFLETPEHLTVRAQFPKHIISDAGFVSATPGLTADFVLARKESGYSDGRRPDTVEPGTLMDDLRRRDFTMNAVASRQCLYCDGSGHYQIGVDAPCENCEGTGTAYIDPFNGREDIAAGIIRAVGDPIERLTEDALRAVRALRFAVTKGFHIHPSLSTVMQHNVDVHNSIQYKISDERIQVELSKMFRYDTVASLMMLNRYPALTQAMFAGNVSLDSTLKTKGRGK